MAIRKNTRGAQLSPGLLDVLARNGMQASIDFDLKGQPKLVVQGHDSPLLEYNLTDAQIRKLSDWGTNYANNTAYNTFVSLVQGDFNVPRNFVHARNVNTRVNMGLHGYRVSSLDRRAQREHDLPMGYGTVDRFASIQAANRERFHPHGPVRRGFLGRIAGAFLGWTPRQQAGYHLRRIDGQLIVPERADGKLKPGELRSGDYGFYYAPKDKLDPLQDLGNIQVCDNRLQGNGRDVANGMVATERIFHPLPYKELISSPVYFTSDKYLQCLDSHGITIDSRDKTISYAGKGIGEPYVYPLSEEQLKVLTDNSLKNHSLEARLQVINEVLGDDFKEKLTHKMLESKEPFALTEAGVSIQADSLVGKQANGGELDDTIHIAVDKDALYADNQSKSDIKAMGVSSLPIAADLGNRFRWVMDQAGGRIMGVANIIVQPHLEDNTYDVFVVNADMNECVTLSAKEYNHFNLLDEHHKQLYLAERIKGLDFKEVSEKELVRDAKANTFRKDWSITNSNLVMGAMAGAFGMEWKGDVKGGRVLEVGDIQATRLGNEFFLTANVGGIDKSYYLTKQQFDKYLNSSDYERLKLFDELCKEVKLVKRTMMGEVIETQTTGRNLMRNAIVTEVTNQNCNEQSKGWFLEGDRSKEVAVSKVGVARQADGRFFMVGQIGNEVISKEIVEKDYQRFIALDDSQRLRLFSKTFEAVDLKSRLTGGEKLLAAIAAGTTVLAENSYRMDEFHRHPAHGAISSRPAVYFKPGVDTPADVAARSFELQSNQQQQQENLDHGLRR